MKTGFKEEEVLLSVPVTGDIRTTKSELTYYSELIGALILVPVDVKTDLGSIPKVFQLVFPKDGLATFAYILHDYLYQIGIYTRKQCDAILEEAMQTLGVTLWRRKSVKAGLKVGGWRAWNNYRKGK